MEKELNWRSVLRFIDYEWDQCALWQQYLKVADPSANPEEQKRDFYKTCVDPKLDLKAVLADTDREEFLDRSHYEVHLLSLHASNTLS